MAIGDIPGNINQPKRTSLSELTRLPVAYSQPGPVRPGARPVREQKGYPWPENSQGRIEGNPLADVSLMAKLAPAALGLTLGGHLDTRRNALISAAGGDPATASGGERKYTQGATHAGMAHGYMMDQVQRSIDPASMVLAATGAQPRAAQNQPSRSGNNAPPPFRTSDHASAEQAAGNAPQQQSSTDTDRGQWAHAGYGGIAGRLNDQGVPEFSNRTADVAAAGDRQLSGSGRESGGSLGMAANLPAGSLENMGNGSGGLSVMSGGREAMLRNQRATEIMQQTRHENSNPNYLTVVRDSGRPGREGRLNREANERDSAQAAERRDQHQQRTREGASRLAQFDQQVQQQMLAEREAQRMESLRALMGDPRLSDSERATARQAYLDLTVQPRDRFMLQDVILERDQMGQPIIGRVALDTLTGQTVSPGIGQGVAPTVTKAEVKARAKKDGVSEAEVVELLQRQGIEVRN